MLILSQGIPPSGAENRPRVCFCCPYWQPIPGRDIEGLCPHLQYPYNKTIEYDSCHLNKNKEQQGVSHVFNYSDTTAATGTDGNSRQ